MNEVNDVNNARYLKYRSKFFVSEFFGTALLLLGGLSIVIFMFGSGSPMAQLIPCCEDSSDNNRFPVWISRCINCIIPHRKSKRSTYQSRRYDGILAVSQD